MSEKYVLVEATATFKMKYAIPVDDINPHGSSDEDLIKYAEHLVSSEKVNDLTQEYMGDTITASGIVTSDTAVNIYDEHVQFASSRTKEQKLELINKWEINE